MLQARNTDFPGYWGGLASQNRGGVSSFYGYDSQGSARILTSILGAITDRYAYMAFGVELATGLTPTTNPNRYLGLFGYYRDFINWMYVRARMLDALRGRWVSRDMLGFNGGSWNLIEVVGNNPIRFADPSGLAPCPKQPPSWCWLCEYHRYWRVMNLRDACQSASMVCGGTPPDIDCNKPPRPYPVCPPPPPAPTPKPNAPTPFVPALPGFNPDRHTTNPNNPCWIMYHSIDQDCVTACNKVKNREDDNEMCGSCCEKLANLIPEIESKEKFEQLCTAACKAGLLPAPGVWPRVVPIVG